MTEPCKNTDREIWRGESNVFGDDDNTYADRISVTTEDEINIISGGNGATLKPREWVDTITKMELIKAIASGNIDDETYWKIVAIYKRSLFPKESGAIV